MGGANNYSGRVEVCVNGEWGTVCGDSFTQEHARAVCNRRGIRHNCRHSEDAGVRCGGMGPHTYVCLHMRACVKMSVQMSEICYQTRLVHVHSCPSKLRAGALLAII